MGTGPGRSRTKRALSLRAAFGCLWLAILAEPAFAQQLGNGLLNPKIGGFVSPQDLPLRAGSAQAAIDSPPAPPAPPSPPDPNDPKPRNREAPAESRIGKVPTYGLPAASGAKEAGYDSLNRKRKLDKYYPAQAKPKKAAGPGSQPPKEPPKNFAGQQRLSVPPSEGANKQPLPPAMADNVPGQPVRRRMKLRRRSVRRGRRLCRQLPDQVGAGSVRRLRHQSRPHLPAARPARHT